MSNICPTYEKHDKTHQANREGDLVHGLCIGDTALAREPPVGPGGSPAHQDVLAEPVVRVPARD